MSLEFSYISLHEFLDKIEGEQSSPLSKEQIIALKKQFRKDYLKAYKKYHRSVHKVLTISVSNGQYIQLVNEARKQGIKLRDYILLKLYTPNSHIATRKVVLTPLLTCLDILEEALFEQEFTAIVKALEILINLKTVLI